MIFHKPFRIIGSSRKVNQANPSVLRQRRLFMDGYRLHGGCRQIFDSRANTNSERRTS
ncbi:hypothetical protein HMPREF1548_01960 [Clostridium sp. KLE 1755]|nr:hypothetical protein HMPREF1548_01960 [Clostridium sp. KLE 1755]